MLLGFPNPDPMLDQKMSLSTPFLDLGWVAQSMVSFNHWLSSIKPIRCQGIKRWLTLTMLRATGPWPLTSRPIFRPEITLIRTPTKRFLKIHFEFAYIYLPFLFIWNWNDKCSYTPVVPSQNSYPIPDQNVQSLKGFRQFPGYSTWTHHAPTNNRLQITWEQLPQNTNLGSAKFCSWKTKKSCLNSE